MMQKMREVHWASQPGPLDETTCSAHKLQPFGESVTKSTVIIHFSRLGVQIADNFDGSPYFANFPQGAPN